MTELSNILNWIRYLFFKADFCNEISLSDFIIECFNVRDERCAYIQKDSSIRDFLSFPSPSKLHQLGKGLTSKLKTELGDDLKDVEKTVNNLVKISCIVQPTDDKTKNIIFECADIMLKECFQGHEEATAGLVVNACLVYLGLLKGEDKKYRPPSDISGPLFVLEHCVQQQYFPKLAKEILQMFISKPHPLLDKASAARHKILQTLYSI